jgi:hypothetical protein
MIVKQTMCVLSALGFLCASPDLGSAKDQYGVKTAEPDDPPEYPPTPTPPDHPGDEGGEISTRGKPMVESTRKLMAPRTSIPDRGPKMVPVPYPNTSAKVGKAAERKKTSPNLYQATIKGTHFPKATVMSKTNEKKQYGYRYQLRLPEKRTTNGATAESKKMQGDALKTKGAVQKIPPIQTNRSTDVKERDKGTGQSTGRRTHSQTR